MWVSYQRELSYCPYWYYILQSCKHIADCITKRYFVNPNFLGYLKSDLRPNVIFLFSSASSVIISEKQEQLWYIFIVQINLIQIHMLASLMDTRGVD